MRHQLLTWQSERIVDLIYFSDFKYQYSEKKLRGKKKKRCPRKNSLVIKFNVCWRGNSNWSLLIFLSCDTNPQPECHLRANYKFRISSLIAVPLGQNLYFHTLMLEKHCWPFSYQRHYIIYYLNSWTTEITYFLLLMAIK